MPSRTVSVGAAHGLHARPAARLVQATAAAGVPVLIGRPGEEAVDAASIVAVMQLALAHGEQVELSSSDEAAGAALDGLVQLLASDLDQPS